MRSLVGIEIYSPGSKRDITVEHVKFHDAFISRLFIFIILWEDYCTNALIV